MNAHNLECFRHDIVCTTCRYTMDIGVNDIKEQVEYGHIKHSKCGSNVDLRESVEFPLFGQPESLFGLKNWMGERNFEPSENHDVIELDLEEFIPRDTELIYWEVIPKTEDPDYEDVPCMLAPGTSRSPWPLYFRFYVPPGGKRSIQMHFVVKPNQGLPLPIEIALQGVRAFHQRQLNVASVMLASSIEASIREALKKKYEEKKVKMPLDVGFSGLLERARLLLCPPIGPLLAGNLKELANEGRNPAAHGRSVEVNLQQVVRWMVDAATVYEWMRIVKVEG